MKWCGAIRVSDRVEGAVGEREVLGEADRVGAHPRRRVGGDDAEAALAQPPGDVSAAGGDVERGLALGPRDEQVEVVAGGCVADVR